MGNVFGIIENRLLQEVLPALTPTASSCCALIVSLERALRYVPDLKLLSDMWRGDTLAMCLGDNFKAGRGICLAGSDSGRNAEPGCKCGISLPAEAQGCFPELFLVHAVTECL